MNTLTRSGDCQSLEKTLLNCMKVLYQILRVTEVECGQTHIIKTSWCTLLKMAMDEESWEAILLLPSKINIILFIIFVLNNVYISPYIYSKHTIGASSNCPKCKIISGNRFHIPSISCSSDHYYAYYNLDNLKTQRDHSDFPNAGQRGYNDKVGWG